MLLGCAVDPDALIEERALEVRIDNLDSAARSVQLYLLQGGDAVLSFEQSAEDEPRFYVLDLGAGTYTLQACGMSSDSVLQCAAGEVGGGARSVTLELGPCAADDGPPEDVDKPRPGRAPSGRGLGEPPEKGLDF